MRGAFQKGLYNAVLIIYVIGRFCCFTVSITVFAAEKWINLEGPQYDSTLKGIPEKNFRNYVSAVFQAAGGCVPL